MKTTFNATATPPFAASALMGGGLTIDDLREAVKSIPTLPDYKLVRVSDKWAVLLKDGKPEHAILWELLPPIHRL
jgi:hypothetical protein